MNHPSHEVRKARATGISRLVVVWEARGRLQQFEQLVHQRHRRLIGATSHSLESEGKDVL